MRAIAERRILIRADGGRLLEETQQKQEESIPLRKSIGKLKVEANEISKKENTLKSSRIKVDQQLQNWDEFIKDNSKKVINDIFLRLRSWSCRNFLCPVSDLQRSHGRIFQISQEERRLSCLCSSLLQGMETGIKTALQLIILANTFECEGQAWCCLQECFHCGQLHQ